MKDPCHRYVCICFFAWKGFYFYRMNFTWLLKISQICQIYEKYVSNYYLILLTYIFFSWCSIEDKGVNIISWNWILLCVVFFSIHYTKIGLICRWKGILNIFVMLSNFFFVTFYLFLPELSDFLVPTTINWKFKCVTDD